MKPCILFLTCANKSDADKIAHVLLSKKLVSCVKMMPINSSYLWKNKIEKSKEILLIMDSLLRNYDKIDDELKKIHSYDTHTLFCVEIEKLNKKASDWIITSLS